MIATLEKAWGSLDHSNRAMKVPLCADVCPAMPRRMGIIGGAVPLGAEKNGVLEERKW
jgi:hypothetical protein